MFTYLELKNFKSFGDIEFNFKRTSSETKKLVVIYGENGIGKTNFVTAYVFLMDSLFSMYFREKAEKILDNLSKDDKESIKELNFLFDQIDLTKKIEDIRMIGNDEDTEIEYGFEINGIEGNYKIVLGDSDKIKSEKLYYQVEKNRGTLYEINQKDKDIEKKLNEKIFFGKEYKDELMSDIDKYWSKNTFLSIILKELEEKNEEFIQNNIKTNLFDVMDLFMSLSVVYRNSPIKVTRKQISPKNTILQKIDEGTINKNKVNILDKYRYILKDFFTQAYSDVKDVYYETKTNDKNDIYYKLFFKKKINGNLIDIDYKKESSGTRKILNQFNYIIGSLWGNTVVIDEIDNGIHDLLMKAIVESIKDEITGQLIITTHNTLLMETLDKQDIYIIVSDYKGQKQVNCIDDYDIKIQKNHNIRELYLKGVFGGIPSVNMIDFTEIKEKINSKNQDKKGGI